MQIPYPSLSRGFVLLAVPLALVLASPVHAGDDSVFQANCAKCHGAAGDADTAVGKAMNIPSFVGSAWAEAEPEAICEKVRSVPQHRAFLKKLDAEQLAAACHTVHELAEGGS